mmetsp:Transcript_15459/g.30528  ORF Transcript_15459/g.30528 Transcript_15459/m.30528 type:complete len:302 (-) Transcript_15459:440-1345(-)
MRDDYNKKGLRTEGSGLNGGSAGGQLQTAVQDAMGKVGPLAGEWLVAIAIGGSGLLINKFIAPHTKMVPTSHDEELSYPLVTQQVPEAMMIALGFALPLLLVIAVCEAVTDRRDMHINSLMLTQALAVSVFVTTVAKKQAGRPRPNFYAMCKWNTTAPGVEGCTAGPHGEWESRQSFPSGHSSFAFSGMMFLALFLLDKVQLLARKRKIPIALPLNIAQLAACLPVGLAMWVAITRVVDFWHNYDDILAGSVLGTMCAYQAWVQRSRYTPQWFSDRTPGGVAPSDTLGLANNMEEEADQAV